MASKGQEFIEYDFVNRLAFTDLIDKAVDQIGDLRFAMGEIARDWFKSNNVIFQLQSAGGWSDFKNEASHRAKINAVGFDYPLLMRDGLLAASLTNPRHPYAINIPSKFDVVVGTTVEYAIHHQFGTKFMDARPPVFIGPESKAFASKDQANKGGRLTRWTNIVEGYVQRVLDANGMGK